MAKYRYRPCFCHDLQTRAHAGFNNPPTTPRRISNSFIDSLHPPDYPMLDSPAAATSRALKRSASAASLTTPPRTLRKQRHNPFSRQKSDSSVPDNSDEEVEDTTPQKKQRTNSDNGENVEASRSHPISGISNVPLLYLRAFAGRRPTGSGGTRANVLPTILPVTPPPSNRNPIVVLTPIRKAHTPSRSRAASRTLSALSPPCTPTPRLRSGTRLLLHKSPKDPFLATPSAGWDSSDDEVDAALREKDDGDKATSGGHGQQEKPTMEFVS